MKTLFIALVFAGCTQPDPDSIAVTTPNALGVVALDTQHVTDAGGTTFEMRGVDAANVAVAVVRLDVPVTGESQITITIAGAETRFETTEREVFRLPELQDARARELVQIDQVADLLAREANIAFMPGDDEAPYLCPVNGCEGGTSPPRNTACPLDLLQNTYVEKCCYTTFDSFDGVHYDHSVFVVDTNRDGYKDIVVRNRNPYGSGCKASNGTGTCYGTDCYFGPLGFSRTIKQYGGASLPYQRVWTTLSGGCTGAVFSTPQTTSSMWTNVTGWSTAKGCPDQYGNIIVDPGWTY